MLGKKKSKCPKKNFQSVKKGEKNVSVEFRVFEKKKKSSEKKIRVFWVEILLSSCSLVNLQVKVTEKKGIFFSKFKEKFWVWVTR